MEEKVGTKLKYRAVIDVDGTRVQGPVRWDKRIADEDLDKLHSANRNGGIEAVQKLQPELFRIREQQRR